MNCNCSRVAIEHTDMHTDCVYNEKRLTPVPGSGYGVLFPDRTIHAANPDVDYTPFIANDGRVGYEIRYSHNPQPVYLYFNPSDDTDDGEPNVFVYLGTQNDPGQDEAQHWYGINTVLSPLEGDMDYPICVEPGCNLTEDKHSGLGHPFTWIIDDDGLTAHIQG